VFESLAAPSHRAAFVAAGKAPSCAVAAAAARALERHGDRSLVPKVPRSRAPEVMMRGLCVLASYEQAQRNDQASYVPTFIAPGGLDVVTVSYDALAEVDADGDGDPHTTHATEHVAAADAALPELDDLVRALSRCTGTTCTTIDHEFRFGWKLVGGGLLLSKIEVIERPPCNSGAISAP
jgi:hypothetical protein